MNANFNGPELHLCLHYKLSNLARSVQNQVQSPIPIVVSSMLTALSTAMQSFVKVRLPIGMTIPSNLYICTIADSGERKTSTLNLFMKGIRQFENELIFMNQQIISSNKSKQIVWNLRHSELMKKLKKAINQNDAGNIDVYSAKLRELESEKPTEEQISRIVFDDATIEALTFQLGQSKVGGLYVTTEAGSVLKNMTTKHTSLLNTLWDGEKIHVDRQSGSYDVDNILSCSFSVQPDLFTEALGKKENMIRGSGLLARMLVCYPQSTQGFRSISEPFTNFDLEDFNTRMKQLCQFSITCAQDQKIICLEFDESAKRLWINTANDLEANISEIGRYQSVKDVVSKFMNNASRIAALIYFYLYGDENEEATSKIPESILHPSIMLMGYYLEESLRLFGEKSEEQVRFEYAQSLFQYLARTYNPQNPYPGIEKQTICRNGPRLIRKAVLAQIAIDELVSHGYLYYHPNGKPLIYWFTHKWFLENGYFCPPGYYPPC